MRHLLEGEEVPHLRPVLKHGDEASVVGSEELPQNEEGKELGLGEIVTAVVRTVARQSLLGDFQSGSGQSQWRFGHRTRSG